MTDIDWLAVDMVCSGTPLSLRADEKRAVMRRLGERMLKPGDTFMYGNKLSAAEVARRLNTTERSVSRYNAELPPARKQTCPVCRQDMWISCGVVEAHADAMFIECPMSGRPTGRGLAAVRPDLYQWLEVAG